MPNLPLKRQEELREGLCNICNTEYPVPWYAPNELWNSVMRQPDGGKDATQTLKAIEKLISSHYLSKQTILEAIPKKRNSDNYHGAQFDSGYNQAIDDLIETLNLKEK